MNSNDSDQKSQHLTQRAIPTLPWQKPIIPRQRIIINSTRARRAQCRVGIIRVRRASVTLCSYIPSTSSVVQHTTAPNRRRATTSISAAMRSKYLLGAGLGITVSAPLVRMLTQDRCYSLFIHNRCVHAARTWRSRRRTATTAEKENIHCWGVFIFKLVPWPSQ